MADAARILIVDDEPLNVDLLEQELELLGCATLSASDGLAALERLAKEPVELVLLDVMMPRLDGFQVLARMKADPELRHVPVIMISALDQLESAVRGIELGAEDYLPKPFDPVLLKARIGACLEKKRWHDREVAYRREIERERERADRLLHAILPAPAVAELKAADRVTPRRYEGVAVLFADIVDFTAWSEAHPAEEVVANLDRLIEASERLVALHGLEKIKTTGDGLMATANLLQGHADPVLACVRCGLAISEAARSNPAAWQLRVGIQIGPVVAGVVGRDKFSFDVWGDTVNVAARLASLGSSSALYLSAEAWSQVAGRCAGEPLGPIVVKGKGDIEVHRCLGILDDRAAAALGDGAARAELSEDSAAEVQATDVVIVEQFGGRAGEGDPAGLEHVGVRRDPERHPRVLLDQDHADAVLAVDRGDQARDLAHDHRRKPE
jgi:adenylate cyclase